MKPAIAFKRIAAILTGWAILLSTAPAAEDLFWLDGYNVVWTAPSKHSGESMPVGSGDIGLNVWVEDGDVLFYVDQSGCVDENGALLKHGRVRISLEPNPFVAGEEFYQVLKLHESCVEITGRADGAPRTTVRLWVEVHRPVVHADVEAAQPVSACATFETWRYQDIFLDQGKSKFAQAGMAMMNRDGFPGEVWLYRGWTSTAWGWPAQPPGSSTTGATRAAAVPSRSPCWDCPAVPCGVSLRAGVAAGPKSTSTAFRSTEPLTICIRPSSNSPT